MIPRTIDTGLQHWARFKRHNSSRSDLKMISRLGVTASPGPLISDDEIPKPGDQHLILTLKGLFDYIENGFHNLGHFTFWKAHLLIDLVNDIDLCHAPLHQVKG